MRIFIGEAHIVLACSARPLSENENKKVLFSVTF